MCELESIGFERDFFLNVICLAELLINIFICHEAPQHHISTPGDLI